jgi:hypothetical protein
LAPGALFIVIAGLDPAIHAAFGNAQRLPNLCAQPRISMDARVKPAHDAAWVIRF